MTRRTSLLMPALGLAGFFAFCAHAQAKAAYLQCNAPGAPKDIFIGLTVDYDASTVVSSFSKKDAPEADANGVAAQPAQISDAAIVWKIVTPRVDGKYYAWHLTLSRYTGELTEYDDGTQVGHTWTCQLAAAPPPAYFPLSPATRMGALPSLLSEIKLLQTRP
jgi:hypothetical protein